MKIKATPNLIKAENMPWNRVSLKAVQQLMGQPRMPNDQQDFIEDSIMGNALKWGQVYPLEKSQMRLKTRMRSRQCALTKQAHNKY